MIFMMRCLHVYNYMLTINLLYINETETSQFTDFNQYVSTGSTILVIDLEYTIAV